MSITVEISGPYERTIYDSTSMYAEVSLSKLAYTSKVNAAGSAEFTLPREHLYRDDILPYRTLVEISRDETLLFRGRVLLPSDDFFGRRTFKCEGEFNFLCDSVVSAGTLSGTPSALLAALIGNHNSQVDAFKQFVVGTVNVSTSVNPSVDLKDATSTASALTQLLNQAGGVIHFDTVNGSRTISWLASAGANAQEIHYGANLLDLSIEYSAADMCNRVVAFGKATDGVRVSLPSPGYVQDTDAQAIYGVIAVAKVFNECEDATELAAKAMAYLNEHKSPVSALKVKAVDLSARVNQWDDSSVIDTTPWEVGKTIKIISAPHGINGSWLLTQRTYDLLNPQNDIITLGTAPVLLSEIVNH